MNNLSAVVISSAGPANGLRVEVWDGAGVCPDLVDVGVTDARGRFKLQLERDYVASLIGHRTPTLAFRVFDGDALLPLTKPVSWSLTQPVVELQVPIGGRAGGDAKVKPSPQAVRGTVSDVDGKPIARRVVRAFDRNLGRNGFQDIEIGHATTDGDGRYEIRYRMPAGGKVKPDLIVRLDPAAPTGTVDAAPAPVIASELMHAAPATATVNLGPGRRTTRRASEYQRIVEKLAASLQRGGVELVDLDVERVTFAANSARIADDHVRLVQQAQRLARDAKGTVAAEIFYGLLRTGFRGGLIELAGEPLATHRDRLRRAIKRNFIARSYASKLKPVMAALGKLLVADAMPETARSAGGKTVAAILGSSLTSPEIQTQFLTRWASRKGSTRKFWADLYADSAFANGAAADLDLTFRLGALFDGRGPALAEARKLREAGQLSSLRDLAKWTDDEWDGFLQRVGPELGTTAYRDRIKTVLQQYRPTERLRLDARRPSPQLATNRIASLVALNPSLDLRRALPANVTWGDISESEREATRNEWNAFRSEALAFRGMPAKTLLAGLVDGKNPVRETANRVLLAAADLDMERDHVEAYLARKPEVLDGVDATLRAPVVDRLKAQQRVLRVVADPKAVDSLLADGLDSAFRMARVPSGRFVKRYATVLGGEDAARTIHMTARRTAATAQLALTTTAQTVLDASPLAVRGGDPTEKPTRDNNKLLGLLKGTAAGGKDEKTASWPDLFGETTWCSCDDCQSVYSPAAYLVDLLNNFLDQSLEDPNPADVLFDRRPDLPYLKLSCENTNTTLPYIDLVNEVLEIYVATHYVSSPTEIAQSYDTGTLTPDELRAVPQNVRDDVYELLATQVYPFSLPFHRPLAVVRAYLDQLGTSYADVLDQLAAGRYAAERLGLSSAAFDQIANPPAQLATAFGFAANASNWQTKLADVPELLARTGVTYEELVDLVKTFFVNPNQYAPHLRVELDPPLDCKLEGTKLNRATTDTWDRLYRFIRLWRAVGWSIADLDRALYSITRGANLDPGALVKLATLIDVQRELGQPLVSVMSLWSQIDTWGTDALYLKLFDNRTVASADDAEAFRLHYVEPPPNREIDPDVKSKDGFHRLELVGDPLQSHFATLLAALRVAESDLDLIWNHVGFTARTEEVPDDPTQLELQTLTTLYRHIVLAKGLGMRIADLVALIELTGVDPFGGHDPSGVRNFIDFARKVQRARIPVATLDYIFRDTIVPAQGPAPADSEILGALTKVWSALRTVRQDNEVADDSDGMLLATRLAIVHPPEIVQAVLDALDPASGIDKAQRDRTIADQLASYLDSASITALQAPDPVPAAGEDPATVFASRRLTNAQLVLEQLSAWLRTSLGRTTTIATIASTLGLPDALVERMVTDWISSASGTALDDFLALGGTGLATTYVGSGTTDVTLPALQLTRDDARRGATWTGRLLPLADGPHVFVVRTNGTATLSIGGTPVIDAQPVFDGATPPQAMRIDVASAPIELVAGQLVDIEIDYGAGSGAGTFELLWALESSPTASPIAVDNLYASMTASFDGPRATWRLLHKAALLINGLHLVEDDLDWANTAPYPFAGFQLGSLPMTPTTDPVPDAIRQFERLADYSAVRDALPAAETTLVSVLRETAPTDITDPREYWAGRFAEASGWDAATIASLLDPAMVDWTGTGDAVISRALAPLTGPVSSADLQVGRRLDALADVLELVRRVGVAPTTLMTWAEAEPTADIAREVVQAVRARYTDDADWFEVARTRNDVIREASRDALVAFLLPRMDVADADELFEYFLIDVEMASCMATSRIKQAISSVQLFIDRILLNLEKHIAPDVIDPDVWPWNKNYRVWEANRKIFLYPENWIEPELRDPKTPFFEELESALRQAPLEDDFVEDSFLAYLDKLDQVARLDVCATYWQQEDGSDNSDPIDVLHVVARTPGSPTVFFYRTLVDGVEWTPWEKIDLEIETEAGSGNVHMVLTVHDRRLYLLWATFLEKPESEQPPAVDGASMPTLTHWEIRLAWSTYREGHWSAKQLSAEKINSNRYIDFSEDSPYQDEIDAFEEEVSTREDAMGDAQATVDDKEGKLWNYLWNLRQQLIDRLKKSFEYVWRDTWDDDDAADEWLWDELKPLFSNDPSSVVELEMWLSDEGKSFETFLEDIYAWPKNYNEDYAVFIEGNGWGYETLDELDPFTITYDDGSSAEITQSKLLTKYDNVLTARDELDEATDSYNAYKTAWGNFTDGGDLAIPDERDRNDHTFWQTEANGIEIAVLRHYPDGTAKKVATFTLSDDSRTITSDNITNEDISLTKLTPKHSTASFGAFKIQEQDAVAATDDTPAQDEEKGLDLKDLEDLLGNAQGAKFVAEHKLDRHITGNSPRPFFINLGSDCHVALPYEDPDIAVQAMSGSLSGSLSGTYKYTDADRAVPSSGLVVSSPQTWEYATLKSPTYHFEPFHHPFVLKFIKRLNRDGVDGLLSYKTQTPSDADDGGHFVDTFDPSVAVDLTSLPPYDVDFRAQGAYAIYNWEIFFHAPFLIAIRLMQDQRFEEARDWFHYIFDPTTSSTEPAPGRYWKLKPFREGDADVSIRDLLTALADPTSDSTVRANVRAQIKQWTRYPADPHRIAALRPSAYQKATVMRYLDNLIAWGDSLFAQDTIESINEATQLYVLASHILGPRPERIPPVYKLETIDFATIRGTLDDFSNLVVDVENLLFPFGGLHGKQQKATDPPEKHKSEPPPTKGKGDPIESKSAKLYGELARVQGISHIPVLKGAAKSQVPTDADGEPTQVLYFCVPDNDKLLGYWDTVDDRLFKIRHCMNIEGVERQLPLFEPPLDPALLVRAAAAGLDIGSVLQDLNAPRAHQRFAIILQKANELCSEVRSLGGALLAALEKRDGETLALLKATHEAAVIKAVRAVKQNQLEDATVAKQALEKTRDIAQAKFDYYDSREFVNSWEDSQASKMATARTMLAVGGTVIAGSAALSVIPKFDGGPTGMGIHATTGFGGHNLAAAARAVGDGINIAANALNADATAQGILGGHHRRQDDWDHNRNLAGKELVQIERQLAAADIKIAIATQDLANQDLMIENATKIEQTLKDKYTNEELYSWMLTRIADVYYQAYKLAYDMAKRAERCYRYELGVASSSYIRFGYWDSLRKGLLAGEQLGLDLKRLDAAYLQGNRREYELTRQISLVLHDPQAFMKLRETGACEFDLPEELFDADYPGHYFRRLKTVSVTLPCVAGPYTPINCTLTLLASHVRISATTTGNYPEHDAPNDVRFSHDYGSIQRVATSHGQNDAGMFEVNFRDDRYLPFEGTGAVSSWRIELPRDCNAFDFDTLSDIVMKVSYTARDGGAPLAAKARDSLRARRATTDTADGVTPATPLRRLFRVRYEFSDAWIKFRNALALGTGTATLELVIDRERFPYLFRGKRLTIVGLEPFATATDEIAPVVIKVTPPHGEEQELTLTKTADDPTILTTPKAWPENVGTTVEVAAEDDATWTLRADAGSSLASPLARDLLLLVTYTAADE